MEVFTTDHTGHKTPLRYFYDDSGIKVILLHDSARVLEKIFKTKGNIENLYFVLSSSWHMDEKKCEIFSEFVKKLHSEFPDQAKTIQNNIIFSMNSEAETIRFRQWCPSARSILSNNTCFLSERAIHMVEAERSGVPVMNAKPLLFKRHYLTSLVPEKDFISYGKESAKRDKAYQDIESMRPRNMYWDISASQISTINSSAACGLALSEIEGACYASTEYLLSGLPVVSTISLGGRDEFYTQENSIICKANAESVAAACNEFKRRAEAREIDHLSIRSKTIEIMMEHRRRFTDEIATATGGDKNFFFNLLIRSIEQSNKLYSSKNFWISDIEITT